MLGLDMCSGALWHGLLNIWMIKGESKAGSNRSAKLVTMQWCRLKSTRRYNIWSMVDKVGLIVFSASLRITARVWALLRMSMSGCSEVISKDFRYFYAAVVS